MKQSTTHVLLSLFTFFFFNFITLPAQQTTDHEIVIVQKITDEDGTEMVKKVRVPDNTDIEDLLERMDMSQADEIELHIRTGKGEQIQIQADHLIFRQARKLENEQGKIFMRGHKPAPSHSFYTSPTHSITQKAFLGVYPDANPHGTGVLISGIVSNTGAEKAGLQSGDILVGINETKLILLSDLGNTLARHKPGETVQLSILRDDTPITLQATLTEKRGLVRNTAERDPCQVFIGIYTSSGSATSEGVRINSIIEDTPAATSNLRAGDLVLALDGNEVSNHTELLRERNKHQPGDFFTLLIQRDQEILDIKLQFTSCEETTEKELVEVIKDNAPLTPDWSETAWDHQLELTAYKAFPNPTYGNVNLTFQAEAKPTIITITDVTGKVVYSQTLNQFNGYYQQDLDLSGATPGFLFVTIQQEGRVMTDKIVLLARA